MAGQSAGCRGPPGRSREAKAKYESTGEVEYVSGVDSVRLDVGMPGLLTWSWYQAQADRGIWDNRHAVMSDAQLLSYESLSVAVRLTKPFLVINGDNCALPDQAKRHFASSPPEPRCTSAQTFRTWTSTTAPLPSTPPSPASPTGSPVTSSPLPKPMTDESRCQISLLVTM